MTDDLKTRIQANCRSLSLPTARHVAGLLQRLEAEHETGSEEVIERAFSGAVRAAWTQDEPWGRGVVRPRDREQPSVRRGQRPGPRRSTGWEPVDTVAALSTMDHDTAAFLLGQRAQPRSPADGDSA
ncbi:hypothetical protein OG883_46150 [Streptomyces sp. NBC_01142]|uniref:hypothetical protein n=1 Tax=Streptomyces sp. NBC_01142 TaxID=2975865 RepID=UPI00225106C4|nr:hypothetical protein [Streptomyces sp. NBC_01142]MCX4827023.1 hypothetical protein [Streptomyces sp. NBC_01142]